MMLHAYIDGILFSGCRLCGLPLAAHRAHTQGPDRPSTIGLTQRMFSHWAGDPYESVQWRDDDQREFYASWDAFDAALRASSILRVADQQDAEVARLERLWRL